MSLNYNRRKHNRRFIGPTVYSPLTDSQPVRSNPIRSLSTGISVVGTLITIGVIAMVVMQGITLNKIAPSPIPSIAEGVMDPITGCRFPNQEFLDARDSALIVWRKHVGASNFVWFTDLLDFDNIEIITKWPEWTENGVSQAVAEMSDVRNSLKATTIPNLSEYQRTELFNNGETDNWWYFDFERHATSPGMLFSRDSMCSPYGRAVATSINLVADIAGLDLAIDFMNNFATSMIQYADFHTRSAANDIVISQTDADLYPSRCLADVEDGVPIVNTIQYAPFAANGTPTQQAAAQAAIQAVRDAVATFLATIAPGSPYYTKVLALRSDDTTPGLKGLDGGLDATALYAREINLISSLTDSPEDIFNEGLNQVNMLQADLVEKVQTYIDPTVTDFQDFKNKLENDDAFNALFTEEITVREKINRIRLEQMEIFEELGNHFQRILDIPFRINVRSGFRAQTYGSGSSGMDFTGGTFLTMGVYNENSGSTTNPVDFDELINVTKGVSESISWHEALPGHAFQLGSTRTLPCTPSTRLSSGGAREGWGMYSETLARDDFGRGDLPDNVFQYLGGISGRLLRAVRMVVDPGFHLKGWNYTFALDYMVKNNFGSSIGFYESEMRRYIGWPGQALGYLPNGLVIERERARAETALGSEFNLKEYHDVLLKYHTPQPTVIVQRTDWYIQTKLAGKFSAQWPPSIPQPENREISNVVPLAARSITRDTPMFRYLKLVQNGMLPGKEDLF